MKWQDIVNITPEQFNKLTKEELKGYTQILASAGNKRLKRAQQQNFKSPSIEAVLKRGKFSTKDKSFNQLRNEFMRAKSFLESRTGTLSAFNKFKRETIAELAKPEKGGIQITSEQFEVFWRSYEQLKEGKSEIATRKLKYTILQEIDAMQKDSKDLNVQDIVDALKGEVERLYQEEQALTRQAEEQKAELNFWNELENITPEKPAEGSYRDERKTERSAQKAARTKARRKRK